MFSLSNEQIFEQLQGVLFHESWNKRVTPLPSSYPIGLLRFNNKIEKMFYNYGGYVPGMKVVAYIDRGWDIATIILESGCLSNEERDFVTVQCMATDLDIKKQLDISLTASHYMDTIQDIFNKMKLPVKVCGVVIRADCNRIDIFFQYTEKTRIPLKSALDKIYSLVRMRIMFRDLRV